MFDFKRLAKFGWGAGELSPTTAADETARTAPAGMQNSRDGAAMISNILFRRGLKPTGPIDERYGQIYHDEVGNAYDSNGRLIRRADGSVGDVVADIPKPVVPKTDVPKTDVPKPRIEDDQPYTKPQRTTNPLDRLDSIDQNPGLMGTRDIPKPNYQADADRMVTEKRMPYDPNANRQRQAVFEITRPQTSATTPNYLYGVDLNAPEVQAPTGTKLPGYGLLPAPEKAMPDLLQISPQITPGGRVESDINNVDGSLNPSNTETPFGQLPTPDSRIDTLRDSVRGLVDQYVQLSNTDPRSLDTNQDSRWKNIGKSMLIAFSNIGNLLSQPNMTDKQALYGALGTAVGGALAGLVNPYYDEEVSLERQKAKVGGKITEMQNAYGLEKQLQLDDLDIQKRQADIRATEGLADWRKTQENVKNRKMTLDEGKEILKMLPSLNWEAMSPEEKDRVGDALEAIGAPRDVSAYIPNKKIQSTKSYYDPTTKMTWVNYVFKDGTNSVRPLTMIDGKTPLLLDSEQIAVATIRAQTQIATTNARIVSAENMQKLRLKFEDKWKNAEMKFKRAALAARASGGGFDGDEETWQKKLLPQFNAIKQTQAYKDAENRILMDPRAESDPAWADAEFDKLNDRVVKSAVDNLNKIRAAAKTAAEAK